MWDPPADEGSRRYLTEYEITHNYFSEASDSLGSARIGRNLTSHKIRGLKPGVFYKVRVLAIVGDLRGRVTTIVLSTKEIGERAFGSHDTRLSHVFPEEVVHASYMCSTIFPCSNISLQYTGGCVLEGAFASPF